MSGPLWRFLLRRHGRQLALAWLVPVIVGTVAGIVYPTYARNREALRPIVRLFAKAVDQETLDFLSPGGFFAMPFQHPITMLLLALTAALPALALPAGERSRGALDLLLATSLTRRRLVRTVGLLVLPAAFCYGWAPYLGIEIGARLAGEAGALPYGRFRLVALQAGALGVALGGIGLWASAVAEDRGGATLRYVVFCVFALMADVVARFWGGQEWTRWFTPLGYYRPSEVIAGSARHALSFGVLLGVGVAAYALAETLADRRRRA